LEKLKEADGVESLEEEEDGEREGRGTREAYEKLVGGGGVTTAAVAAKDGEVMAAAAEEERVGA